VNAPYDALPPDLPATVEDVRAARRWTWVAFAWAIAASVVAVLALIQANNNSNDNQPAQTTPDLSGQFQSFQQQASARLDAFDKRLNDAAAAGDVKKLDKRLTTLETDSSKSQKTSADQATTLKQLRTDLDALTKRVTALEQQQGQGTGTNTGTSTTP
jgi:hypothetical protein